MNNVTDRDTTFTEPRVNLEGARYVFTVADLISPAVKATNPEWRVLGGVLRPESLCLQYRTGYIPRCEITELRQIYQQARRAMVHPEKREALTTHYEMAGVNPFTGEFEQKTVGLVKNREGETVHDGLLRKPFFPQQEIGTVAGQLDGVVEMPVTNNREKNLVQYFLFPNWDDIKQTGNFPPSLAALRAHFLKLQNALSKDNPHYSLFLRATIAAIRSCDEFAAWGANMVHEANDEYDKAKTNGWAVSYGSDARAVASQLGMQLRDTAAQAQENTLADVKDTLKTLAEIQINQFKTQIPKQETAPPVAAIDASDEGENEASGAVWAVGRRVLTDGRQAEIVAVNPGGNLKVKFEDGETVGVNRKNCELID